MAAFPSSPEKLVQLSTTGPTLLYVFSPSCKVCVRQLASLPSIYNAATALGYPMIALATDGGKRGIQDMYQSAPSYPVAYVEHENIDRDFRIPGTPEFLLVSPQGEVLKVHGGFFSANGIRQEFADQNYYRAEPTVLEMPQIHFTKAARMAGSSRFSMASLTVDATGAAQNIMLAKHLGFGLDDAAISALQHARFLPAIRGGQPIAKSIHLQIEFEN